MTPPAITGCDNTEKQKKMNSPTGASTLKVADAFWYVMLAILVCGSTWGYTSNDIGYLVGTCFGVILGIVSILSRHYSKNGLLITGILIALASIVALSSRSLTLLLSALLILGSKDMDLHSIIKAFFIVKSVSLISLMAFACLGLVNVDSISHYSALAGGTIVRQSINGASTNTLHLGLFSILILYIIIKRNRLRGISFLAMMAINYLFYRYISYSSAGLLVTGFAVLLAMGIRYSKVIKILLCRFGYLVVPVTFIFFMYTGYKFDGTGWIAEINHLMTGRIAYDHYWLTAIGPTWFGINPSGETAAFDNSIIYLVVGLGVFVAALVLTAYFIAMKRLGRNQDAYLLLAVFMFYLFSMSESVIPSVVVNPSLFIVVAVICKGFYRMTRIAADHVGA